MWASHSFVCDYCLSCKVEDLNWWRMFDLLQVIKAHFLKIMPKFACTIGGQTNIPQQRAASTSYNLACIFVRVEQNPQPPGSSVQSYTEAESSLKQLRNGRNRRYLKSSPTTHQNYAAMNLNRLIMPRNPLNFLLGLEEQP